MKEKVKQQPFRSSYDNLIRYNGLNSMFRPVPNDALYFLVNKRSNEGRDQRTDRSVRYRPFSILSDGQVQTVRRSLIKDFFSMMKYSLFATKNEKLISDLNEAFVENNPCFGKSIAKFCPF